MRSKRSVVVQLRSCASLWSENHSAPIDYLLLARCILARLSVIVRLQPTVICHSEACLSGQCGVLKRTCLRGCNWEDKKAILNVITIRLPLLEYCSVSSRSWALPTKGELPLRINYAANLYYLIFTPFTYSLILFYL